MKPSRLIPRRTPLKRGKPPKRRTRPKARYRTKGGRHGDPAKLRWIQSLRCWAFRRDCFACKGSVVPHHVRIRGSRATDKLVIPLCAVGHHKGGPGAIHTMGRPAFEAYHGSTLEAAQLYESEWQLRKASLAMFRETA